MKDQIHFLPRPEHRQSRFRRPRRYGRNMRLYVLLVLVSVLSLPVLIVSIKSANAGEVTAPQASTVFIRQLSLRVNDVAYSQTTHMLYVSVPSSVGAGGNAVTEIDPVTGALGASVFVGSEPNKLALSDNGHTVYVGLDGAASVRRVDMATHTASTQFRLGFDQGTGTPYTAGDFAIMPGNPNAVAVARIQPGLSPPGTGVAVYDDGVQRPNIALPIQGPSYVAFGATASTLYGSVLFSGALRKMTVDGSGVTSAGAHLLTQPRRRQRRHAPQSFDHVDLQREGRGIRIEGFATGS